MSVQVHPAHAPGLVEMRIRPFEPFAAPPQQPLVAVPSNPAAIGIDDVPRRDFALPVAPPRSGS